MHMKGKYNKSHIESMMQNKHVSPEIAKQMAATYLDHNKLSKYLSRGYPSCISDSYDEKLWDEIKDVVLDPYFAPLMADNLKGLPPAYVMTAEQDVLRDEGILYAQRLKEAGCDVTHSHHMNGFHGIVFFLEFMEDSKVIAEKILQFIKERL